MITEFNNSRKVTVLNQTYQNGSERGLNMTRSQVIPLSGTLFGLLDPDRFQVDFLVRFNATSDLDSRELDNLAAYSWNVVCGAPMIPSNDPNNGGALFPVCSQEATRNAQDSSVITTLFAIRDPNYAQVCSQYAEVTPENNASLAPSGSFIDMIVGNPVSESSDPAAVGHNSHDSTDYRALANDLASRAANAVNPSGENTGEGLNSSDIKFLAYAGIGILALVALTGAVKNIKKGF